MQEQFTEIPNALDIRVPLRSRIFSLTILLAVSLVSLYMITEIPKYGMWLGRDLLGLKAEFLHVRLSKQFLSYPLYFIAGLSFLRLAYTVLYLKMIKYKANKLNFSYTYGVLTTITDDMNMADVRDQRERATLVEKMLGLSTIIILSNDLSHKELVVKGIDKQDAKNLANFLKLYGTKNYTDLRIRKEVEQEMRQKNVHKKDYVPGPDGMEDGE